MKTALITICTNRKRAQIPTALAFSHFGVGTQKDVTSRWVKAVTKAVPAGPAANLYCGRGFQVAKSTAASLRSDLVIISAGLGLVSASTPIPAYNATLTKSGADSIPKRVLGAFDAAAWWQQINQRTKWGSSISEMAQDKGFDLILITASSAYAALIAGDLISGPSSALPKIRIFGPRDPKMLPKPLQACLMPYDDRFDGPDGVVRGTRSDFPQRITQHFVEQILGASLPKSRSDDAKKVREYLAPMQQPVSVARQKMTDEEVVETIKKHWDDVSGSSSRMLRLFRDDLKIACEQKRFSTLFNQVRRMS